MKQFTVYCDRPTDGGKKVFPQHAANSLFPLWEYTDVLQVGLYNFTTTECQLEILCYSLKVLLFFLNLNIKTVSCKMCKLLTEHPLACPY